MTSTPKPPGRKDRIERTRAIQAMAILAIAWIVGGLRATASVTPHLPQALSGAQRFDALCVTKDMQVIKSAGFVSWGEWHE